MKKRILSGILALVTAFGVLSGTAGAEFHMVTEKEFEKTEQHFTTIDISSACNSWMSDKDAADDDYGWTNQGSANDMSGFDLVGKHTLIGIDFDFVDKDKNDGKNCIVLRGQNDPGYPIMARIPVNATAAGVYVLHSCAWGTDKSVTGYYVFEYADGTEATVELICGRDIQDWWGQPEYEQLRTAWKGPNGSTEAVSWQCYAMENPQPGKVISNIVARTSGKDSYMMVAAMTLTDIGPIFPEIESTNNTEDRSPDTTGWYRYGGQRAEVVAGTAIDCSKFLDAPAGKHGRLIVDETGNFAFKDGTKARFWATNLAIDEGFPTSEYDAEMLAQQLAQDGFNLVRFHIIDHRTTGQMGIFGIPRSTNQGNSVTSIQKFDENAMRRLCYLLYQLKQRGIYYLIDTAGTGQPALENDNIPEYTGVEQAGWRNGPGVFDKYLIQLNINQTSKILNWYNPYTECKIGDDEALAMIMLHNEFGFAGSLYLTGSAYYRRELAEQFNDWLRERYVSTEELREAWTQEGRESLREGESLEDGTVEPFSMREHRGFNFSDKRVSDNLRFYSDNQEKYYSTRVQAIRDEGFEVLVGGATDWEGGLNGMVAQMGNNLANTTDFMDRHAYNGGSTGGSFAGDGIGLKAEQWIKPSVVATKHHGFLSQIVNGQTYRKPQTVTEWNTQFSPVTHEGLAIMSAFSCMYNWNPFLYNFGGGYSYSPGGAFERLRYSQPVTRYSFIFASNENPIMATSFAAAAMMNLRNDIDEVTDGFYRRVTEYDINDRDYELEENLYWRDSPGDNDYPLYYGDMALVGRNGRMYDTVEYDPEVNNDDVLYKYKMTLESGEPFISGNGQIRSDTTNGTILINTERSQVATGYISDTDVELDDVIINIDNEHGTVYATSLSYEPIWNADEVLITAEGQCWPENYITEGDNLKIKEGVMISDATLVEQITGTITLKTREDVEVIMLSASGTERSRKTVTRTPEGWASFEMELDDKTPLYLIRKKGTNFTRTPNTHIEWKQVEREAMFDDMGAYSEEDTRKAERMVLQDYIYKTGDKKFSPDKTITRGDFSRLLTVSMLQKMDFEENYSDLKQSDLSYAYAGSMRARGIATEEDTETDTFRAADGLTFRDYAVYLSKSQTLKHVFQSTPKIEDRPKTTWKDVDLSDVAGADLNDAEYTEALKKLIYWGYMDKADIPTDGNSPVSRMTATLMLYKMLWE